MASEFWYSQTCSTQSRYVPFSGIVPCESYTTHEHLKRLYWYSPLTMKNISASKCIEPGMSSCMLRARVLLPVPGIPRIRINLATEIPQLNSRYGNTSVKFCLGDQFLVERIIIILSVPTVRIEDCQIRVLFDPLRWGFLFFVHHLLSLLLWRIHTNRKL